ncbi:hypothetical protein HK096_001452 [Nowakowskiella sp. JEL0078]|nr:hypothetical protein HK096_001452 [Nowakowskiella sp. JEL0078]
MEPLQQQSRTRTTIAPISCGQELLEKSRTDPGATYPRDNFGRSDGLAHILEADVRQGAGERVGALAHRHRRVGLCMGAAEEGEAEDTLQRRSHVAQP